MENGKPKLDIPVITKQKYDEIEKLRIERVYKFVDICEPLIKEIMPKIKIDVPKHLSTRISEIRKYQSFAIPVATIKEAVKKGDFYSDNCTPPMVMVIEE